MATVLRRLGRIYSGGNVAWNRGLAGFVLTAAAAGCVEPSADCILDEYSYQLSDQADIDALNQDLVVCPNARAVSVRGVLGDVVLPKLQEVGRMSVHTTFEGSLKAERLERASSVEIRGAGNTIAMPSLVEIVDRFEWRDVEPANVELSKLRTVDSFTLFVEGDVVLPWLEEVGSFNVSNTGIRSLALPALTRAGALELDYNAELERFEAPLLENAGDLRIAASPKMTDLDLGSVAYAESVDLYQVGLTDFILPRIEMVEGDFRVQDMAAARSIQMTTLGAVGGLMTLGDLPLVCVVEFPVLVELGDFNSWNVECETALESLVALEATSDEASD